MSVVEPKKPWAGDPKILLLLLASLVLVLAILPIFERYFFERPVTLAALTAVFVIGLIVNRRRPRLFISGIAIAAAAIPITWATLFFNNPGLFVLSCLLGSFFFAMTGIAILAEVLRHFATVQSVLGAICVYLLLGLTWAMLYWAVARVDAGALDVPQRRTIPYTIAGQEVTAFSQMVYFSFVTMSTLGYGDVTPTTSLAEMLTWMESVVGQFYLAILVARLVSALPAPERNKAT